MSKITNRGMSSAVQIPAAKLNEPVQDGDLGGNEKK